MRHLLARLFGRHRHCLALFAVVLLSASVASACPVQLGTSVVAVPQVAVAAPVCACQQSVTVAAPFVQSYGQAFSTFAAPVFATPVFSTFAIATPVVVEQRVKVVRAKASVQVQRTRTVTRSR